MHLAQQLGQFLGLDAGEVALRARLQRGAGAHVTGRVALDHAVGERVLEDLAGGLPGATRDVERTPGLDLLGHGQELRRCDLRDGLGPDHREHVGLHPAQHVLGVTGRPRATPVRVPGPRDRLEGRAQADLIGELGILALLHWVGTVLQRLPGLVARQPGLGESRARVAAQRDAPLLAAEAVLPAPVLGPAGQNLQVQPTSVGEPQAGLALGAAGVAACRVGKGHLGEFPGREPESAPRSPSCAPGSARSSMMLGDA